MRTLATAGFPSPTLVTGRTIPRKTGKLRSDVLSFRTRKREFVVDDCEFAPEMRLRMCGWEALLERTKEMRGVLRLAMLVALDKEERRESDACAELPLWVPAPLLFSFYFLLICRVRYFGKGGGFLVRVRRVMHRTVCASLSNRPEGNFSFTPLLLSSFCRNLRSSPQRCQKEKKKTKTRAP